ncbi:glycosyltransferase family 2 protein [Aurantivibrio infirmus]
MFTFLFWLLAFLSLYSYFFYPLCLKLLVWLRERSGELQDESQKNAPTSLTLIITAYNEEERIAEKLENTLELDFNSGSLEIIVASDCSSDRTDEIVKQFEDRGVRLVRAQERLGKENAQLTAIRESNGDVIVFSDTATKIPEDGLTKLVEYFADPKIGAVSSEDRFVSQSGEVAGEGAYVKYEMWLRGEESKLAGLIGLSGSFFAARREVCAEWDIHSPSDFNTALNCARLGLVAVTAPDVLGFYQDLKDPAKEYQRKIRTVIRGITALSRHAEVLNPFTFGVFSFQVISHKLMRWLVPWFLIALFLTTAIVANQGSIYALALIAQIGFYIVAIAAHYNHKLQNNSVVKIIYFFVQVNIALFDASCRYLAGTRMTTWTPSAR